MKDVLPAVLAAVGFGAIATFITDDYLGVRAVCVAIAIASGVFAGMAAEDHERN